MFTNINTKLHSHESGPKPPILLSEGLYNIPNPISAFVSAIAEQRLLAVLHHFQFPTTAHNITPVLWKEDEDDRSLIINESNPVIMGKKQKSKRNSTAAATLTSSVPFVREVRQHEEIMEEKRNFERILENYNVFNLNNQDYLFPKSNFYVKASLFKKKGNLHKSTKFYLQGLENSCVQCIVGYSLLLLKEGHTSSTPVGELWKNNKNVNLAFPLLLEGAVRGNTLSLTNLINYCYGLSRIGASSKALQNYWTKDCFENTVVDNYFNHKDFRKKYKTRTGEACEVCGKRDSETVTLKRCERCTYYYYCSSDTDNCQSVHWHNGHAGECRQLEILKKYHRPYQKKIRSDIFNGIDPKDIPELQELRDRLGLSKPKSEYQDLLNIAKSVDVNLIVPRKSGTVQIGSFPGRI